MITKNELKKLIEQELKEFGMDLGSKGSQKEQVKQFIDDNWVGGGSVAQVRQDLLSAVDALKDRSFAVVKAYGLMDKGEKVGLVNLLLPAGGEPEGVAPEEVDPLADTVEADPLAGDTVETPAVTRKNKTITESRLRQIIKEELELVLTNDEVKEMFGIDISEEGPEEEKI